MVHYFIILVTAEGLWHLGSLFYHDTQYSHVGVLYNFTLVWYSMKQGTTHKPTSHLAHLYAVPFLRLRDEHRWQRSWLDDFVGQCRLWQLSSRTTIVVAALGLPTSLRVGRSWLFPASSVKFLTRSSLKSQWVYLAPHEDNNIQLLKGGKTILWSTWSYINSSNSCWPCDQNCWHNPCGSYTVPWCEVSQGSCCHHKNFLLLVVGPYLSACKLLVCPSKLMWSNLPCSSPLCHPFQFQFWSKVRGYVLSVGSYCPA